MSYNNCQGTFEEDALEDIFGSPVASPGLALPQPSQTAAAMAQRHQQVNALAQTFRHPVHTQLESKTNAPPPHAKISHARNKNSPNRISDYEWYDRFPVRQNWTTTHGNVAISYSINGEFTNSMQFDRTSLLAYIVGCRHAGIPLRLWIQNPPAMHNERYMTKTSHTCRYARCPVASRKIMRGMMQVCLDEHPTETSNGRFDPFYAAGYFHLFCLEEMASLPELMQVADVEADMRDLPLEERNPMSLNRDEHLLDAFVEWREARLDQYVRRGEAPPTELTPGERLVVHLMHMKVAVQPKTRQRKRDQRGGLDVTKHWGDLRKYVALGDGTKKTNKVQKKTARPAPRRQVAPRRQSAPRLATPPRPIAQSPILLQPTPRRTPLPRILTDNFDDFVVERLVEVEQEQPQYVQVEESQVDLDLYVPENPTMDGFDLFLQEEMEKQQNQEAQEAQAIPIDPELLQNARLDFDFTAVNYTMPDMEYAAQAQEAQEAQETYETYEMPVTNGSLPPTINDNVSLTNMRTDEFAEFLNLDECEQESDSLFGSPILPQEQAQPEDRPKKRKRADMEDEELSPPSPKKTHSV